MSRFEEILSSTPLPFVGRQPELERLVTFWRETEEADGLRATVVVGEAGIGKSRLIGELIPRVEGHGGVVIHVRLYPEGRTSIGPLLQRAVASSRSARPLLRRTPEASLGSMIAALRRLTRLRPTLLIVEDTEHLAEESLGELVHLADALATDPLAILTLSRPVEHAGRQLLNRYRVDEIELGGLAGADHMELWQRLFGAPADPDVVDALRRAARGNPMAVRSALRGALRAGMLDGTIDGPWSMAAGGNIETVFRQSAEAVPLELTVYLSDAERCAAERLATLGEIFSRESAELVLRDHPSLLTGLISSGIIATTESWTSPLPGKESASGLLAFTHSLLHDYLARDARPDIPLLAEVIGHDLPLYSVTPVLLFGRGDAGELATLPLALLHAAITRLLSIGEALNRGADWRMAPIVWECADRLFKIAEDRWSATEHRALQCEILTHRIFAYQRGTYNEEYAAEVARFMELTEQVSTQTEAEQRISALLYAQDLQFRHTRSPGLEYWEMIDELLERFPELLRTQNYIHALQQEARLAGWSQNDRLFDLVEERLRKIEELDGMAPELVHLARTRVGLYLLPHFRSAADVAARLRLLEVIDRSEVRGWLNVLAQKVELFHRIGRFVEVGEQVDRVIELHHENGLPRMENRYRTLRQLARLARHGSVEEAERGIRGIFEASPVPISNEFRRFVVKTIPLVAALNGRLEWSGRLTAELASAGAGNPVRSRLARALSVEGLDGLAEWLAAPPPADEGLARLHRVASMLTGRPFEEEIVAADLRGASAAAPVTLEEAHDLRILAEILDRGRCSVALASLGLDGKKLVADMARLLLAWLFERALLPGLRSTLERFSPALGAKEEAAWHGRISTLAAADAATATTAPPVHISMLGTILITKAGEEPHRLRGSRLSTLLGLLVADRMLGRSLSPTEFRRLVFDAADPEYGRRMLNGAVWRLREILGHDLILTDGETPRLDTDRVEVDLLVADTHLVRAIAAVHDGTPMRAVPLLMAALDATRGEVPFPGLYDEFFEAARDDFESRLRHAVIDVAETLLREEDPLRAEEVLRRALETIPGDEDLSLLLQQALVALGRSAEARLVARRAAHAT